MAVAVAVGVTVVVGVGVAVGVGVGLDVGVGVAVGVPDWLVTEKFIVRAVPLVALPFDPVKGVATSV